MITKDTLEYIEQDVIFRKQGNLYKVTGLGNTWTYTNLKTARQAFYYLLKAATLIKNIKN